MQMTIEKVQPGTGKVSTVVVSIPAKEEGKPPTKATLKHWTEAPLKEKLTPGAVVNAKTEERPGYNGAPPERWLVEVDGVGEKAARQGGGGGGGGFKSTPKTPAEIHSSCIAGIIKSGLDAAMPPATVSEYLDLYWKQMAKVAS